MRGRRRIEVDPNWLYDNWVVEARRADDLACELGCSRFLIYERAKEFGFKRERRRYKHSEENKKKWSELRKNQIANGWKPAIAGWWAGKKRSEKFKLDRSRERNGKYLIDIPIDKIIHLYTKEKKSTIEIAKIYNCCYDTIVKRLRRSGIKIEGAKGFLKGRKLSEEHIRKCLKRRIPTKLEEDFEAIIKKHELPYRYVGDGSFIIASYNPDFINTNGEKIAIEVYAKYFKQINGRNIDDWKKDRSSVFNKYGWDIIYFDETQINENYVLEKLK